MAGNSNQTCSYDALEYFSESVGLRGPMLRVNALVVMNAILMGVMVGIGAYGHRYRHHPLTRFLFLGATTLFLPIVSYVVSASGIGTQYSSKIVYYESGLIEGHCRARAHVILVLAWTGLVLIIGINTTAIVAADAREGRNIPPDTGLLVQAIWTSYLAVYLLEFPPVPETMLLFASFGLIFAKLLVKCYAWYMAKQSLALGRNPRLIVGYMEQLQHDELGSEYIPPPPLIVTGEHTLLVEKKPRGYNFKSNTDTGDHMPRISNNNGLVTFDKVWQLNDTFLRSKTQLKDLCFSFALFKLFRCRIARYTIVEAGFIKARNFLRHVLLEGNDVERVLAVIAHELSFLHDCYYSSHSILYSKSWLPILSIFISLLSIGYCLFATFFLISITAEAGGLSVNERGQIYCLVYCKSLSDEKNSSGLDEDGSEKSFGNLYFDLVPLYLLAALVVLAEVRDIASYICSNWTKVDLICHYVNHGPWQQSPTMQRCVGCLLQCEWKLMKNWEDKMNQCSVLVLHPTQGKTLVSLLRRLIVIPLPDQQKKVPSAVKAAIVGALRSHERSRINADGVVTHMQRSPHLQVGDNILWTFNGAKGTADTMLVCHIATTILEVKSYSHPHQPLSDHRMAANHLSRYCAYLVAYSPELLPEDDEWCKSLYKAVKKDAKRVLGSSFGMSTSEAEYPQQLIKLLSAERNHEVLKDGARLARQLAGLTEGEQIAWEVLAGFWSEMILYVAPSINIDGHVKAIARGGELITLIWALVTHLGIVGRPDDTAATTDGVTADV